MEITIPNIVNFLVALSALVALFVTKKTRTDTRNLSKTQTHQWQHTEEVNDGVLEKFSALFERVAELERKLLAAERALALTREELAEVKRLEAFLDGKLHEKEREIEALKTERAENTAEIEALKQKVEGYRKRIAALEKRLKENGIHHE